MAYIGQFADSVTINAFRANLARRIQLTICVLASCYLVA